MLVVATLAFGEAVRLFFFNFNYQVAGRRIRSSARMAAKASGRSATSRSTAGRTLDVMLFIWAVGRAGDGGVVVDGPLARRRRAARGRRG